MKDLNEVVQKEEEFWREKVRISQHLETRWTKRCAASQHERRKLVIFIDGSCRKQQLSLGNSWRKRKSEGKRERVGGRSRAGLY